MGEGDSSLFKWRTVFLSMGRWLGNSKNTLLKFKNLLLQNHWANFNQIWLKASLVKGLKVLQIRIFRLLKRRWWVFFSKSTLLYNYSFELMGLLVWYGFSGEQCGQWASCLYSNHLCSWWTLSDHTLLHYLLLSRSISQRQCSIGPQPSKIFTAEWIDPG